MPSSHRDDRESQKSNQTFCMLSVSPTRNAADPLSPDQMLHVAHPDCHWAVEFVKRLIHNFSETSRRLMYNNIIRGCNRGVCVCVCGGGGVF